MSILDFLINTIGLLIASGLLTVVGGFSICLTIVGARDGEWVFVFLGVMAIFVVIWSILLLIRVMFI